jgi:hypothetical protein
MTTPLLIWIWKLPLSSYPKPGGVVTFFGLTFCFSWVEFYLIDLLRKPPEVQAKIGHCHKPNHQKQRLRQKREHPPAEWTGRALALVL